MDKVKLDNNFNELLKTAKLTGRNGCSDQEWKDLYSVTSAPKVQPGTDWFYYSILIVIILIVILICISLYYNTKPNTKVIDSMNDSSNKSYGFPVEYSDIEYDEDGNEVVFI